MWFISVAICDTGQERVDAIRDVCTRFAIRNDVELQLLRFTGENMREKLLQYADVVNLAAISLDMVDGPAMGIALYHQNPDCHILYYKQQTCDLEPFLCARPISFYGGAIPSGELEEKLFELCREIWSRSGMLRYQSKALTGLLPYSRIAYAESDRKYLNVHTVNHAVIRLYQKLDDLEKSLHNGPFVRVHQSYLVNLSCVACLDKMEHTLYLLNGENIPVSKAYYTKTVDAVSEYKNEPHT